MRASLQLRLVLLFLILAGGGNFLLVRHWTKSLRPAHLRSMEESMVDLATVLASTVAVDSTDGSLNTDRLQATISDTLNQQLHAKIYELTKTQVDLRVYVTDANGIVLYDSASPSEVGYDYTAWNDVLRTLRGEYGARSTRADPNDPSSSTIYVASPIIRNNKTVGVLSVGKHVESLSLFIDTSRKKTLKAAIGVTLTVALLIGLVVILITRPIRRLTEYARSVAKGERPAVPQVSGSEMSTLAAAFEDMRDELEGKKYIEQYVENLTHEMKSPLTAICANAELLSDQNLTNADRQRFLDHVGSETNRLQTLVDRMLQLAELESRKGLDKPESIDLSNLLTEVYEDRSATTHAWTITLDLPNEPASVQGDRLLLRQALINLLDNAIAFSPKDGIIQLTLNATEDTIELIVQDNGSGLADYALNRATERFFSTPRPRTNRKSSGLGLAFVNEIAKLHDGTFTIANAEPTGATAKISLPR